jgi:taurine dioxygenase
MTVGAEVTEFDSGAPIDEMTVAGLYDAWLQYGILLFHDVRTWDDHIRLSRCFGELEFHPMPEIRFKEQPLFIELSGSKTAAYFYDGELKVGRLPWHRDTAYTPDICKGAMMRIQHAPARGGETLFCDAAKAYDGLPEELRQRIAGLEFKATLRIGPFSQSGPGAIWQSVRQATEAECPGWRRKEIANASVRARYPSVVHPVVYQHPESARRCLFISPTYVDSFLGLAPEESKELLAILVGHLLSPENVYVHRWRVNDAIVWDNCRFLHAAAGTAPDDYRQGLRTTLAGSVRTGRFFEEDAKAPEGFALAD